MLREKAISNLLNEYKGWYVISDIGKAGREIFKQRQKGVLILQGSMGHSLSVSLGLALNCPSKRFVCLIGDGALLMKLGSLATIFDKKPKNLDIIVLNNNCHDSTGGQLTSFHAIRHFIKIKIIDIEIGGDTAPRPNKTCKQIADDFRKDIQQGI